MNTIQDLLAHSILKFYPNAEVKKINKDNYLDIHLPMVNPKRGSHLFFNTTGAVIKMGFYCRDEKFTLNILNNNPDLEAYSQGIRLKDNPVWKTVGEAISAALIFISKLSENSKNSLPTPDQTSLSDSKSNLGYLLLQRIKEVYPKCSVNQEKSYVSFTFKAAFLYELRIQKGIIRLLAANYPQKAPVEKCFELITRYQIAEKQIQDQFEILVEPGKVSPDKLTVRIEIPYKVEDLGSEAFHSKIIDCCDQFHDAMMPLINGFQSQPVGKLQEVMSDGSAPKSLELEEETSQRSITFFEAIKAYKENKFDIVSKYVEQGDFLLQFNDEVLIENELISYVSASDALNSSIENLVNKGINLDDTTKNDACGYTAVHFAAWDNKTDILKFLLEKGANPNAVGLEDGLTPLYLAAVNGNFASVELLLKYKADPNIILNGEGLNDLKRFFSIDGGTALRGALVNFQFDIAFLLIKYGASKEELLKPCIASDFPTTNFINLLSLLGNQNPNRFNKDKYETLKSLIDGTQVDLLEFDSTNFDLDGKPAGKTQSASMGDPIDTTPFTDLDRCLDDPRSFLTCIQLLRIYFFALSSESEAFRGSFEKILQEFTMAAIVPRIKDDLLRLSHEEGNLIGSLLLGPMLKAEDIYDEDYDTHNQYVSSLNEVVADLLKHCNVALFLDTLEFFMYLGDMLDEDDSPTGHLNAQDRYFIPFLMLKASPGQDLYNLEMVLSKDEKFRNEINQCNVQELLLKASGNFAQLSSEEKLALVLYDFILWDEPNEGLDIKVGDITASKFIFEKVTQNATLGNQLLGGFNDNASFEIFQFFNVEFNRDGFHRFCLERWKELSAEWNPLKLQLLIEGVKRDFHSSTYINNPVLDDYLNIYTGVKQIDLSATMAKVKDEEEEDFEEEEDDKRGFPMLRVFKNDQPQEVIRAYLRKWQKPSLLYAGRLGIKVFIPDFVEELTSDQVCPVFTNEQIELICSKISKEKIIPILSYAPDEFFYHTKRVWWIVPFCIWKEDTASLVFVDKNGFYASYETDGEVKINMIFPWEKVHNLEFEYNYHDDPFEDELNVNRLTLFQEDGGYLTFDEFVSEGEEGDHGSYLAVIEAIWEARRETIEASRGESVWLEGEGGETFEVYEHPSEICKSADEIIAETINKLKTIINFYVEWLTLKTESSNSLEYVIRNDNSQLTSYIFEINNDKQIQVYIKTTNEIFIKNAQNDGYLTKNFEWKDGLLKLIKSKSSFSDAFGAVKSFFNDILYLKVNGAVNEIGSKSVYYIQSRYYGDHPFGELKYDLFANSLEDVKELLLFRGYDVDVYLKVIKDIYKNAIDLLDSLFDLIREEIEFRSQNNIRKINISNILSHCNELIEKGELSYDLYVKIIIALNDKYEGLKSISNSNEFIDFLEKNGNAVEAKIAYSSLADHLKTDQAILQYLLSGTRKVFHLFPEQIKRDKVFILSWINKVNEDLKQAEANKNSQPENEEYLKVFETKNKSAGLAPHILTAVDDSLIGDEELLIAALSSKYVSFIEDLDPEKWAIDKEWAVKAAKINIHSVAYLPKYLKNDVEVCKALLAVHLSAFNFFEEDMKRNKAVQTFALKKDGYLFQIFPEDLKCNKDFIKNILGNCYDNDDYSGYMIFAMCEELKKDQELIDLAVERNPSIFKKIVAPSNYTIDIFKHYLKVSPYIFKLVPDEWQYNRELMIALLSAGFDSNKRESLFKASAWFNDEAFALSLIQSSNYSYSLKYIREDFRIKPEIVHAFLQKFPEPEHIAVLPAKQLGVDFFRPLVNQNLDFLFFINNKEVADTLLENYKTEVLEKVKYIDLRFFDRMGALNGNSEVFKAFMANPLISSRYLEQPGYYIEEDSSLMEEIGKLLVHFQLPFFDDRYNKSIDRKGLSFEHKNQKRLKYMQSLSGEETALFKLLMSDPCPEIREEAAKRIALGEEAFKEILDKGVPIVTHYEYGKSIVENQKDLHVLRGLSMNPLYESLPTSIKEKFKSFKNNPKEIEEVKIGNQIWMSKNLDVDTFRNGDPIPHAETNEAWEEAAENQEPAWCYYDNDPANGKKYGKLYNWYAVNDPRGLAPEGWHVSSDDQWTALTDYLGGDDIAGLKIKSKDGWAEEGNGTDQYGFNALPGGLRKEDGEYEFMTEACYFWTSTEHDDENASDRFLTFDEDEIDSYDLGKSSGYYIRCIMEKLLEIENPITGAKLRVANQDFSMEMTWLDAQSACEELGEGWRLPTIDELQAIHEQLHEDGTGDFKDEIYWSSTEDDAEYAKNFWFSSGDPDYELKSVPNYVRAVRDL